MLLAVVVLVSACAGSDSGADSRSEGSSDTSAEVAEDGPKPIRPFDAVIRDAIVRDVGLTEPEADCVSERVLGVLEGDDALAEEPSVVGAELADEVKQAIETCLSEQRRQEVQAALADGLAEADAGAVAGFTAAVTQIDAGLASQPEGAQDAALLVCDLVADLGVTPEFVTIRLASERSLAAKLREEVANLTGVLLDEPQMVAFAAVSTSAFCPAAGG